MIGNDLNPLNGWNQDRDFDDIFSGIVVGWVHSPASFLAQCRWGQGKLLATTLRLESAFGDDPVATILLQDLIAYLMSPRFQPKKDLHARATRAARSEAAPRPAEVAHRVPKPRVARPPRSKETV